MRTVIKRKAAAADAQIRQKRKTIITGAVVLGFAFIGLITVISLLISLTASIFDNSEQKAKFEKFISPVVMVDPVAFSSVSQADEHALLMSSMWNLLMNVGEDTAYPEDEYGMMIIPSSDLDVSAANLFGSEVALSHQSFSNTSITFEYDEENSSYIVPPMGYTVQYQPRVDKIQRKGKIYTLTVAYISSGSTLMQSESDDDYDKLMYYVLEKTAKDKYIIRSIQDSQEQAQKNESAVISSQTVSSDIAKNESSSLAAFENE